jgi:hypothetical protein
VAHDGDDRGTNDAANILGVRTRADLRGLRASGDGGRGRGGGRLLRLVAKSGGDF